MRGRSGEMWIQTWGCFSRSGNDAFEAVSACLILYPFGSCRALAAGL